MIAPQKVVKRLFPAGLAAGSCSELQPDAITIWLSPRKSLCDFLGDNHIVGKEVNCFWR